MKSVANDSFWKLYHALPDAVRQEARRRFASSAATPLIPGFLSNGFVAIPIHGRCGLRAAIGRWAGKHGDTMIWYWIGSHAEFDKKFPCIMSPSPDPPFDPQPQGISLDELAEAFAQVMGVEPRRPAESPAADERPMPAAVAADGRATEPAAETPSPEPAEADDPCPISPRTILEAMLFVGNRDNRPLSPARAAELMRDVAAGRDSRRWSTS